MPDRPTPDHTRREGVPARPVRLADGLDWGFARPTVRLTPEVVTETDRLGRPVERVTVRVGFGYPPAVRGWIDGLQSACEGGNVPRQYEAFFGLAAALLRRAHEVSLADACDLLAVDACDLPRLVREVMSVVSEAEPAPGDNLQEVSAHDSPR